MISTITSQITTMISVNNFFYLNINHIFFGECITSINPDGNYNGDKNYNIKLKCF